MYVNFVLKSISFNVLCMFNYYSYMYIYNYHYTNQVLTHTHPYYLGLFIEENKFLISPLFILKKTYFGFACDKSTIGNKTPLVIIL